MKINLPNINKLLIVFLIGVWQFSSGQTIVNTGQFVQTGNYVVLNSGTKWQNNGTANLQSGSNVYFSGNADQDIDGTSSTAFANLRINNSGTHGVIVKRNIQVLGTLTMSTGYLDVKNYEVDMSTSGTLTGETETCRVRATDASWNDGGGSGQLKATRTNPTGNVAGFGLNFTPSINMGSTVIYRGHQSQTGANLTSSIFRYFELQPATYATLTINPLSYFDAELNSISPESGLKMVQLYNSSNYWQQRTTTLNTTTNQAVGGTGSNSLTNIKVTLAKSPCTITATASSNSAICSGSTLNLSCSATNSYGILTYNWSGPNSFTNTSQNPSISGATTVASGTYYVTITDELLCTATASVSVTVNALPNVILSASPNAICNGSSSTLTAGGATSYSWDNGLGTGNPKTVNPSSTTTYNVTGTDANGCSNSASATVTVNSLPSITVLSNSPVCGGSALNLSATGGTTYNWSGPGGYSSNSSTPVISPVNGSNAGTYYVTVTDGNNCSATGQTNVIINAVPELTVTSNSPVCSGQNIQLTSSSAVSYNWTGPAGFIGNQQNPTVLNAQVTNSGTYNVTITDGNGCTNSGSVNVTVNQTPTATAGTDQTIPYGTSTSLTGSATNGSGNYSYSWTPVDSLVNATIQNPTTVNLEATTTFTLTVTDNTTLCTATDQIVVTINGGPLNVVVSATPNVICSGNNTQLLATASGGSGSYSYTWSSNPAGFSNSTYNPTVSPTSTTVYTVTINDGFNTVSGSVTVSVNSLPTVYAGSDTAICAGNPVTLIGSGANTYTWDNGVTDNVPFTPLSTATYTVTGTDSNGCVNTDQVNVTVNPLPTVVANASSTVLCNGNSVTLTGSGTATSYVWDNSVTDGVAFIPTATSIYTVTGTDGNNCSSTDQITVAVNPVYLFNESAGICNGQPYIWHGNTYTTQDTYYDSLQTTNGCDSIYILTLNVGAAYQYTDNHSICQGQSYLWHGQNYNTYGTYYDSLQTASGCDSIFTLVLAVNPTYNYSENQTICQGSSYIWHGNTYSTAGTYYDNLTTALGCDSVFVLNLIVNPAYSTTESYNICQGDSLLWHGGYYSLSGEYRDSLTAITGCDSIIILNITTTPLPDVTIQPQSNTICQEESTSLMASGAGTYLWSTTETNATITVNPTNSTTYFVVGTNNGCSDSAFVTITVKPLPNINIIADHQAVCPGSAVVITASGADSYLWSNSDTTNIINVSPQNTTTYTVTGTLSGCTSTASTQIMVYPSYNFTQNAQVCNGSIYTWNGNNYTSSGTYTLNLQTVNGCDSILNLQLAVNPKPVITINASDTLVIIGNTTTLTVSGDATSFEWIPATGLSCNNCADPTATPDSTTNYCVIGSNTSGCSDTACIVITVDNDCGELFIPLAFSPNGDNHNDTWKVQGRCVKTFELMIYDRWGEKIFESTDQNQLWDGYFNGKSLDTDVYVYILNITMRDGEVKNLKGDITLMK